MKRIMTASLAMGALALPSLAVAAGPFDGTWQVDSGGLGTATAEAMQGTGCEPISLKFEVKDNQVQGGLAFSPSDPRRVENSQGRRSAPITGTVAPDGTVNAQWESYKVTGTMTGDKVELRWRGSCGQRVAMGSRLAPDTAAGSTTPPATTLQKQEKSGYFPAPDAPLVPVNPSTR